MKVLIFYSLSLLGLSEAALVTTQHGQLQGMRFSAPEDPPVYAYLGIPFAVPPVGELAFQETQILDKWDGILNATKEGKYCIGSTYLNEQDTQSEDCLFLNIYSPSENLSANYPVMVYVHGGRYINGNAGPAFFDPSPLVAEGVIVAIFQYRMGPYGFLSTKDLVIPGNAGMKDQVLALRWIKDNIAAFGGDPEQITLFGESAGGSACGLHVVSKKSAGLFRAAMCQSASALTPFSIHRHPKEYAYQLVNLIDGSVSEETHNSSQLVEFLRNQSPAIIVDAFLKLSTMLEKEDRFPAPTIEQEHDGAFLYQNPYELLSTGDFNRVPYVAGYTSEESLFFMNTLDIVTAEAKKLDTEEGYIFPYDFEPRNASDEKEIIQYIHDMYLNGSSTFSDNLYEVIRYESDDMFNRGVIKQAELQANYVDVYLYQFSYYGNLSRPHLDIPGAEGKAQHGDELGYLFNREFFLAGLIPTETDLVMKSRMVKLWTNFAKYLNPTPEPDDALLQKVQWPKLRAGDLSYLDINVTLKVETNPKADTYSKWNTTYNNWNELPFTTF
ncbi:cocaine esterase-like [Cylas formicarius]|uniref:cocaine esterase-like n=1 Tax=Cylas formicarius TaxID=197179 RepID=UPI002958998C|nr:cocaine esterase-like [Cylas formicarius]